MYIDLREGNTDAVLLKYRLDRAAHLTLGSKEIVLVALGAKVQIHARIGKLLHAVEINIRTERRAHFSDLALVRLKDFLHMLQIFFIGNAHKHGGIGVLSALVDKDLDCRVVGDADIAAVVDEFGVADADLLDRAAPAVDGDDIPHLQGSVADEEDARNDIGDEALHTKSYDERKNACAGDECAHIHAPNGEHCDDADDPNHDLHDAVDKSADGDPSRRSLKDCLDDGADDIENEQGDKEDPCRADELGNDREDDLQKRAHRDGIKDIRIIGVPFIQGEPSVYGVVDLVVEHEAQDRDRGENDEQNQADRKGFVAFFLCSFHFFTSMGYYSLSHKFCQGMCRKIFTDSIPLKTSNSGSPFANDAATISPCIL